MEWITAMRQAINFMEGHLLDEISAKDVADDVHMSSFYLQKGFKVMTGYSLMEYIRCRRLYLAALDVIMAKEKVIDIAYKYSYETPESFTKAFSRFHGHTPTQVKKDAGKIKPFLPLKINVTIRGGNDMDYVVEKMSNFKLIGIQREFSMNDSYVKIPQFWIEFREKYCDKLIPGTYAEDSIEQAICQCNIGEYGVCIEDLGTGESFRYLIAGQYHGGPVPEGMTLYEFPDLEWVKFRCYGPLPGSLQSVNTKIFTEWLPGNDTFEPAIGANIEWYSMESTEDSDYESAIWLPVKRK